MFAISWGYLEGLSFVPQICPKLRVPSPRCILIQLPMARRTTVAVWLLALAPAFVAPEWWRKGHGQSIKSGAFFPMDPIDSAGVGLDPN